jgi:hypothetical protein
VGSQNHIINIVGWGGFGEGLAPLAGLHGAVRSKGQGRAQGSQGAAAGAREVAAGTLGGRSWRAARAGRPAAGGGFVGWGRKEEEGSAMVHVVGPMSCY